MSTKNTIESECTALIARKVARLPRATRGRVKCWALRGPFRDVTGTSYWTNPRNHLVGVTCGNWRTLHGQICHVA